MRFDSPLRYPGGKRRLAEFVADTVVANEVQGGTYVEPFAGGASVALYLLFNEFVNQIIINDIDRSIYSFWYSTLNYTDELCEMIKHTDISVAVWDIQKAIQLNKANADLLELGFSTFFLNRTNRSGILNGGVIGGKEQKGKYKIDARFNKTNLIRRIKKIGLYRDRINLYNLDAMDFIEEVRPSINEQALVYFDPPYYTQGSSLYVNHFTPHDHEALSVFIQQLECKWILTYDYTPEIVGLYRNVESRLLTLTYTAARKTKGCEMLAFSQGLIVPESKYSAISISR